MSPFLMSSRRALLLLLGVLAAAGSAAQTGPQPELPTTRLTAGMHVITAELASTTQSRSVGMMFRQSVAPNHGMLFLFEDKGQQCFWMRNTLLPLSIAFIADDGTILQIADMAPKSEALHCSQEPVRYALEMEQGWYAKKGALAGTKIRGLPVPR